MKKKQHYIPIVLQKEFIDPNSKNKTKLEPYIWVYKKSDKKLRNMAPKNNCEISNMYTLEFDKVVNYSIEDNFSNLESEFGKFKKNYFKNIINNNLSNEIQDENFIKSILILCKFIWGQYIRTESKVKEYNDIISEIIKSFPTQEQRDYIYDNYKLKDKALIIMSNFGFKLSGINIIDILQGKNISFHVIKDCNETFILSDNPVVLLNKNGRLGLTHKNTIIFMPLSNNILIAFSNIYKNFSVNFVSNPKRIKNINVCMASNSFNLIMGSNSYLVDSMRNFIGKNYNSLKIF